MSELKTKVRKGQYKLKHEVFIFDNIILIVAIVLCLAWTYGSITAMTRNWTLAQELASRQREKALLELEVETLELENEYYLSEEYQEIAARKYHNKKLPGETMVYLPANSEAAKQKDNEASSPTINTTAPEEKSNFAQWMAFLFGL